MATKKAIAERLSSVALFSRCSGSDLKIVARHAETVTVPSGRTIVKQGDEGDALFVILSGRAEVVRDGIMVTELGAGEYFGELALLDPAPRAATVTVTSDAELAVLGVRMFRVLLRELPTLATKFLGDLASRVREYNPRD